MAVLAFDTSTRGCSAAIISDGAVLAHAFEIMERGQAERLLPMIDEVIAEAACEFESLDLVATTTGPGAFTGLRIGLAAAQGIALAANIPASGINTFDALVAGFMTAEAHGDHVDEHMLVAVESKREDAFVQLFDSDGQPMSEPEALSPSDINKLLPDEPVVILGDAGSRILTFLKRDQATLSLATGPGLVDARDLGRLAESRFKAGETPAPLTPLYMRPPDAIVPAGGGRLRPLAP